MVKKKVIILQFFLLIMLAFATATFANSEYVFDQANLFSETEIVELQEQASNLTEQFQMDIRIVTTNDSEGKTARQYASDFYDSHGFGYGETEDGILYLIDMDNREVYIFTRDRIVDYFPDYTVEEILDHVYPYLTEDAFGESAKTFLSDLEATMNAGIPEGSTSDRDGGYAQTDPSYSSSSGTSQGELVQELLIYFAIAIGVGVISVGVMAMYNKGRSTTTASTYLESNSFNVTNKMDRHYNTRVTQQKIQQNTNSGGGSFSGGGGGRSGGGGRGF
ncbi:TPM domain-containing protein [Fredinandcohnia sp. QZ13]|uniref:TPM domain-containing protein n=1 Tax=Fredinandcohnia sp. QZ13 TaxID=3073144 RepID=UPI0028534E51|nr:TPM domain-containing protein [Fredinandcohnia sp. QZ13]MDR4886359.1 TPM domain-containing protein [Fredinandcohnia sp. QZ13]